MPRDKSLQVDVGTNIRRRRLGNGPVKDGVRRLIARRHRAREAVGVPPRQRRVPEHPVVDARKLRWPRSHNASRSNAPAVTRRQLVSTQGVVATREYRHQRPVDTVQRTPRMTDRRSSREMAGEGIRCGADTNCRHRDRPPHRTRPRLRHRPQSAAACHRNSGLALEAGYAAPASCQVPLAGTHRRPARARTVAFAA